MLREERIQNIMQSELKQLHDELQQIKMDNIQLNHRLHRAESHNHQFEARSRNERRRFRVQMGLALVAITGAILLSPTNRAAIAQTTRLSLESLDARMKAVEGKTQYLSVDANGNTLF